MDETGFLEKGTCSAGVARQYSGTAGGRRTARSGCSSLTPPGTGAPSWTGSCICPSAWTDDRPRCAGAGLPESRGFATKLELAADMMPALFRLTCRHGG
ncbi:MAG: transposase [Actinomycetota bacterium]